MRQSVEIIVCHAGPGLPKAQPVERYYAFRVERNTAAVPAGRYIANLYFAISIFSQQTSLVV